MMLKVWKSQTGPVTTPWGHQILQVTADPKLTGPGGSAPSRRYFEQWPDIAGMVGRKSTCWVCENIGSSRKHQYVVPSGKLT